MKYLVLTDIYSGSQLLKCGDCLLLNWLMLKFFLLIMKLMRQSCRFTFHKLCSCTWVWGTSVTLVDALWVKCSQLRKGSIIVKAYAEAIDAQLEKACQLVTVNPLFSAISELGSAARSIVHEVKVSISTSCSLKAGFLYSSSDCVCHQSLYTRTIWKRDVSAQERAINDRLLLAERAFLDAKGLARGDWYKHLVKSLLLVLATMCDMTLINWLIDWLINGRCLDPPPMMIMLPLLFLLFRMRCRKPRMPPPCAPLFNMRSGGQLELQPVLHSPCEET